MGKKELIEKWESKEGAPSYEISAFPVNPSLNEMYIAGYGVARKEILDDLKQLDEPKKVVVPKFVAEWISICKNKNKDLSYAMHAPFLRDFLLERFGDDDSRVRWLQNNDNQNILARAWLNGYEVETKQLYYVDVINDGAVHKRLILDHENGKHNIVGWSDNLIGLVQEMFTEQEIKAIDERYWPFAVKVDGE
ncbi:DUF1642 domain-containing protein [Enterococcus faecalis]|uniref:DUF1642 domain-containing protein n=1 Tax=Enterococcus faecalis TaxID=1351 RepID=UPI000D52093A|nr:DUF1642 domain-containing protein [Enterococcus faecalis]EIB6829873.1 DUF1642 domain-containing protein [Enterococcus faecalis]PVE30703.1 hypothetical protein DC007_13115 [Enterococcus faecalis]